MTLSRMASISGSPCGGNQFVGQQNGLLRAGHFGGMQSAVDVHDGLALARQGFRLIVGEPAALRQSARNVLVFVDLGEILRARR